MRWIRSQQRLVASQRGVRALRGNLAWKRYQYAVVESEIELWRQLHPADESQKQARVRVGWTGRRLLQGRALVFGADSNGGCLTEKGG